MLGREPRAAQLDQSAVEPRRAPAAADAVACLEHGHAGPRLSQVAGRTQSGQAGASDDDMHPASLSDYCPVP